MTRGGRVLGVGEPLVIEVVQQAHQTPRVLILTHFLGHCTHGDLDGIHVLSKSIRGGVLVHQSEGTIAAPGHGRFSSPSGCGYPAESATRLARSPSRLISKAY